MVQKLSKRFLLIVIKYIPWLIAVGYLIGCILAFLGLYFPLLTNVCALSIFSFILLISSSFALGFCVWHRIPIYYAVVLDLANLYDYWIGLPLSSTMGILWVSLLFGIAVLLCAYLKNRYNVKKRNTQKDTN